MAKVVQALETAQTAATDERLSYDPKVLLELGTLLADTALDDLDTYSAVKIFQLILADHGEDPFKNRHKLYYIEALAELSEYDSLEPLLERFNISSVAPLQMELIYLDRIAKGSGDASTWVKALNLLYDELNMARVDLLEDDTLPLMDRLNSSIEGHLDGPLVSIIMPTFRPSAGIYTAIRSLLQQSWKNIEIIVVDDGSPAAYDLIFDTVEACSTKVRVIRQDQNFGAYAARNRGLAEASGHFITTHDDDDWSHPEKIASQVTVLIDRPELRATASAHVRATSNMHFKRVNSQPQHLQINYSSLMFRRDVIDDIGPWDVVNRGGDSELLLRISENYGKASLATIADKPLSFSRVWSGSLTSGEMYRGHFANSRLLYRWAFRQWHRELKNKGDRPKLKEGLSRPYPIPTTYESGERHKTLGLFDVLYVTDFSQQSKFVDSVLDEIEASITGGLSVGFMHLASPHTKKPSSIPPRLYDLQLAGDITQVSETDEAEAKLVIVYDASIGMFADRFDAKLVVRKGLIVDPPDVALEGTAQRTAVEPNQVLRNMDRSFATTFQIVGASPATHKKLQGKVPLRRLANESYIWTRPVLNRAGVVETPTSHPIVGFHSFGNRYRWPSKEETFREVYLSDRYDTKLYGVLNPVARLSQEPLVEDRHIVDHNSTSLRDFLSQIDFWVYFPHPRLQNEIWQPVLDAMQAGKVVILPRRLAGLYGDGALYADSEEVEDIVVAYSEDVEKYREQAERGQEYVSQHHDAGAYVARVKTLMYEEDGTYFLHE